WAKNEHLAVQSPCSLSNGEHSSAWCEPGHAGLIYPGLESGDAAQESCHAPQAPIQSLLRGSRPSFSIRRVRHYGIAYFGGNCRGRFALTTYGIDSDVRFTPKADICSAPAHARFGPNAPGASLCPFFDRTDTRSTN